MRLTRGLSDSTWNMLSVIVSIVPQSKLDSEFLMIG